MTILLDPFNLHRPASGDFMVTDDSTYVEARRRMLSYKLGTIHTAPTIVVKDPVRAYWFGDVPTQIVQPRQQLQVRYSNVSLPADLTDNDVLELGLLGTVLVDADIEPTESALLKHFFSGLLKRDLANPAMLYALAQFVVDKPSSFWKGYLIRKWTDKLQPTDNLALKLLTPVRARDVPVCRTLAEGVYIAGWPSLLDDWLHTQAPNVKIACSVTESELRQFFTQSPWPSTQNLALETRIRQHTVQVLSQSSTGLLTLPSRYRADLEAIITVGLPINEQQLTALLTQYADLLTPELRRSLLSLVPPTLLSAPVLDDLSLKAQADVWQRWAVDSFIPYKFWLDELPKEHRPPDAIERMETLSAQYADWLYKHYQSLLDSDDILSNLNVRGRIAAAGQNGAHRVIWLIIDGFPAAYVSLLHDVLSQYGLNRQTTEWAFAPLPTITQIGIPILLNGMRPDANSFVRDNPQLALEQAFPNKKIAFAAVEGKFSTTLHSNADIICIHTQEVDFMLHEPDYRLERSRSEEVKVILDRRIKQIADIIKQSTRKTKLVIATDHGATKCLRNESGIRNKKLIEAATDRAKERCVRLSGSVKPEHVDNEEARLLPRTMTHNPDEWAVAWGYRYFGSNDHGYRHGGLTPEETIVPVVLAEIADYRFDIPQVSNATGKELTLGNRERGFTLHFRNNNDYTVELINLSIAEDAGCQFELPITIPALGVFNLTAPLKLSRAEKPVQGRLILNVRVTYQAQGDIYLDQPTVDVPIQTNELDIFFDF